MRLFAVLGMCLLFGASVASAVEMGTIETGGSLDLRLSPSPWALDASMHLLYYMAPMLGVGPYFDVTKVEDVDADYGIGAAGKLYLPMAYMNGKMTPYVMAGVGIVTVEVWDEDEMELSTETKGNFMMRVGFDYWLTENWTVWTGYQGNKVFADDYDWQSYLRVGVSTFLTK
jgi:hypothetical protein